MQQKLFWDDSLYAICEIWHLFWDVMVIYTGHIFFSTQQRTGLIPSEKVEKVTFTLTLPCSKSLFIDISLQKTYTLLAFIERILTNSEPLNTNKFHHAVQYYCLWVMDINGTQSIQSVFNFPGRRERKSTQGGHGTSETCRGLEWSATGLFTAVVPGNY